MSGPDGVIEVRCQDDGRWRWQWFATEGRSSPPEPLISNEAYESREQAEESAHEAFPDAEVRVDDDEEPGHPSARRRGRLLLLCLLAAAAFAAGRAVGVRKSCGPRVLTDDAGTEWRRVDRPGRPTSARR